MPNLERLEVYKVRLVLKLDVEFYLLSMARLVSRNIICQKYFHRYFFSDNYIPVQVIKRCLILFLIFIALHGKDEAQNIFGNSC